MPKYRGRYKKCRTCVNMVEVHMVLVEVSADCPHGKRREAQGKPYYMSDKFTCEKCQHWQPKEETPCKQ